MPETARERFHRMQQEKAQGGMSIGHPDLKASAPAALVSDAAALQARLRLELRQTQLVTRLAKLGLTTSRAELPTGDADLTDMEKWAADCEAGRF